MAQRRTLLLTNEQKQELVQLRDQTKQEYIRERCAALLKITEGIAVLKTVVGLGSPGVRISQGAQQKRLRT